MRDHPQALMLFAAGFGTRMGALTATRPKPLVPVAGRALIDHALALAGGAGLGRVVVNTHYLGEQIAAHLAGQAGLALSPEAPEILDTGGGLKAALPLLGPGPVFTLNSDAVWTGPNAIATLAAHWNPAQMEGLLLLIPADRARGHKGSGDFALGANGQITRGGPFVYTGAQILRTEGLAEIAEARFSLRVLWAQMAERGTLYGCLHPGGWADAGSPEGLAEAEALLAESLGESLGGAGDG